MQENLVKLFHWLLQAELEVRDNVKVSKQATDNGGPTTIVLMSPLGLEAWRTCLLFVGVFICFEKMGLVLEVLDWKQSWGIKGKLLSRSWRCEWRVGYRPAMAAERNFCFSRTGVCVTVVIGKSLSYKQIPIQEEL